MKRSLNILNAIQELPNIPTFIKPLTPQFDLFVWRWRCPKCHAFLSKSTMDGEKHKCKVCGSYYRG